MKKLEKAKKQKVVAELSEKLRQMNSMFLAEYSGMNVAQMTRLRKELRSIGVDFSVVKNSLLRIASAGTKAESIKDFFVGPNAIVGVYKDPVAAAKVIASVSKDVPQLKLKAGFLGDQTLTPADILKLATLPPRDVLIAKFIGLLKGMPQRVVFVLNGNINKLMLTLNAIKAQKEQQA
ncbi:MAG TPA: 50S ribosomal protein L10 [Syntrophorhabdaceae bacterium]|nr:50S ribosomal protein L10 [Syntrophorhabdaceae bacterium]